MKLPQTRETHVIRMTALGDLGARGLLDRDINGVEKSVKGPSRARRNDPNRGDDAFRGPFDIVSLSTETPTYPALWGHDAGRERTLVVEPDSEGQVRERCQDRAHTVWQTATRLHFNRDFRLNSQSLAACLTPTSALGGRAWPNFLMTDRRDETATVLWANTTLGQMLFWWFGTTQQAGRSNLTISRLPSLPVLDARALSAAQRARAASIFEDFRARRSCRRTRRTATGPGTRSTKPCSSSCSVGRAQCSNLSPCSAGSGARNPPCTAARPPGRDALARHDLRRGPGPRCTAAMPRGRDGAIPTVGWRRRSAPRPRERRCRRCRFRP